MGTLTFFSLWMSNDVAIFDKYDGNGMTAFSLMEHTFSDRVFSWLLIYKNQFMQMQKFFTDVAIFNRKIFHYIAGSLIDHICIKKYLTEDFFTNTTFEQIYFSEYDAVRIIINP